MREVDSRPAFTRATTEPCPVCLDLLSDGYIRREMVMPVPKFPPRTVDGIQCCFDCQSAETVQRVRVGADFRMARLVVGNDRCESLRLPPGAAQHFGTMLMGVTRIADGDDLAPHHDWLDIVLPLAEEI